MNYIFYFFVDLHRTNVHLITSKINANGWHEIPRVTLENENGIVFFLRDTFRSSRYLEYM